MRHKNYKQLMDSELCGMCVVAFVFCFFFFFFSSRRRHTRCREVSWARRCVQETGINAEYMGDLYNNYSLSFCRLRQFEKSLIYVDKAIEIAKDMNEERDQMQLEVNKIGLLLELGNYDEALNIAKKGIKYYKKANDVSQLMWVYRIMTHIYYLVKEYKKSYETGQKLNEITDEYITAVSYTHLRAHETSLHLVCRLLLEKKKKKKQNTNATTHIPHNSESMSCLQFL
eukprot:TRINITY_DN17913_c0_g1_i3.p1 TRINITY_DN17913_c0_g1~~TRINITY_DN17913_c0_g1_i3.p1  ORF type:complete len:228 (+),score=67.88 TRINITY_DN17913_c0_g1_i3:36-719(+)